MNKQDIYTLCTLIPSMDDYSGHNMYLCGKRDGFNECVQILKDNLKNAKEEEQRTKPLLLLFVFIFNI